MISDQQKPQYSAKQIFDMHDVEGNGQLSFDEFLLAVTVINGGVPVSSSAVEAIMQEFDTDFDGQIDEDEFARFFESVNSLDTVLRHFEQSNVRRRAKTIMLAAYIGITFIVFCVCIMIYLAHKKSADAETMRLRHIGQVGSIVSGSSMVILLLVGVFAPLIHSKTQVERVTLKNYMANLARNATRKSYVEHDDFEMPSRPAPGPRLQFSYRRASLIRPAEEPESCHEEVAPPKTAPAMLRFAEPEEDELQVAIPSWGERQSVELFAPRDSNEAPLTRTWDISDAKRYNRYRYAQAATIQHERPYSGGFNPMNTSRTDTTRPCSSFYQSGVMRPVSRGTHVGLDALGNELPNFVNERAQTSPAMKVYAIQDRPYEITVIG